MDCLLAVVIVPVQDDLLALKTKNRHSMTDRFWFKTVCHIACRDVERPVADVAPAGVRQSGGLFRWERRKCPTGFSFFAKKPSYTYLVSRALWRVARGAPAGADAAVAGLPQPPGVDEAVLQRERASSAESEQLLGKIGIHQNSLRVGPLRLS